MLYYFLPNVTVRRIRYVLPGSAFVLLTLVLLLNIFSVYINNYVNHLVDVRFFQFRRRGGHDVLVYSHC